MLEPKAFYVTGGRQRAHRGSLRWFTYDKAVILRVEPSTGAVEKVAEHITPPQFRAETDASIRFGAGHLIRDRFYVCTCTEVIVYSLPSFRQVSYITHPWFNDVHHVTVGPAGELVVVNTGLDMAMVMSPEGELLAEYPVCEEPLWTRFSRDIDYRKVATTQPHKAHANYAFYLNDELWVTRFERNDAVCLTNPERRMAILGGQPHDGVACDDEVYFTQVDGRISVFDANRLAIRASYDLVAPSGHNGPLGWCRGIFVCGPDRAVVGFSKTRRTKFVEKLSWVRARFGDPDVAPSEPTRLARYDFDKGAMLWEMQLDDYELDAVFGVYPEYTGSEVYGDRETAARLSAGANPGGK